MLKFDLARKYLVGLLTVAMVMSLFVLPISAAPEPIVNATGWTATVEPASGYNPVDSPTHTVTIYTKLDNTLGDPAQSVFAATAGGTPTVVITPSIAATRTSTGVYTAVIVYGTHVPATPGTYIIYGFIDADGSGGISEGDVISDGVTKEWAVRVAKAVTVEPANDTNDLGAGNTHSITITVRDQFGDLFDTTATFDVSGFNSQTSLSTTRSSTGVYTGSYTSLYPSGQTPPFVDLITAHAGAATGTATKTWIYTPVYTSAEITPLSAYNMVGDKHEVTVSFLDQYGYPIAVTATVDFTVTGVNPTSQTVAGEDVKELSFSYIGAKGGSDTITAAITVKNGTPTTLTAIKHWAWEWDVTPEHEVNALGAQHTFYLWGAPGDTVQFILTSAGALSMDDLFYRTITDSPGYWHRASEHCTGSVTLDQYGKGEIIVMSQAPGKLFLDVTFSPLVGKGLVLLSNDGSDPYGRTTGITIKASKSFAQLTGFDITPPTAINPITQVATWDVHTITAVALGEFPVKPSLVVPPVDPPEGGKYVLESGVLWVKDAPVAGVKVDWEVLWDYCADGVTVDVFADRLLDLTYLDGGETDSFHQDGDPLTVTHWLHASSVTDGAGMAYLTYHMNYWGKGEATTCTYHFQCLVDNITVTGGYGIPALDDEYGKISKTAEKDWRDYGFKIYKYHDNTQDPNNYIGGAKFFLRRLDLPGTPTYVPPMPANHPWVIGGFTEPVEDPNGPGNAALVDPADPPGVVTTFSDGPEKGAAIWYHLPYGEYGLYEYSVPPPWAPLSGCLDTFTIDEKQPVYWCATPTKIITHYIENTISPAQVYFYKLNDCWSVLPGAVFQATNLDNYVVFGPFTSDAFGKVVLEDLTFDPVWGTWYKVEEIEAPAGFFPVVPFYFCLDKNGVWDDKFYDAIYGNEVYPKIAHPENGAVQHWVKDPSQGTTPASVTFNLLQGWNMVTPGIISDKTAAQIFGPNFVHAYHWDPTLPGPDGSLGGWLFCDNAALIPGWGYWVRMSGAADVTLSGAVVASPVTKAIYKAWEQIGNPFETALSVANVKIVQGATEKSLADAKTAGWIGNAYSWNGTSYDTLDYSTGTLPVGKGLWLRVLVDGLSIKYTK